MAEWLKVIHIIAVISWMAGLLYLPRLMVYHTDVTPGGETSETFKIMERRLLKAIMTPAMIVSWLSGLTLAWYNNLWLEGWFASKIILVILMSAQHGFCAVWMKELAADSRKRTARFFRWVNEIPTLLMIFIIILVEIQPF